jgi:tRNA nucleotidyltransferase (CCA-adding enzyme)
MHEARGLPVIKALCERVRVPNEYKHLALSVCAQHSNVHRADELRPATFLKLFNKLDVWRKPEILQQLLLCCQADHQGCSGYAELPYPQKTIVEQAYTAACSVDVQSVIADGFQGKAIRDELEKRRVKAISERLEVVR